MVDVVEVELDVVVDDVVVVVPGVVQAKHEIE